MDFGTLITVAAQKSEEKKQRATYYKTGFSAPKKEKKSNKDASLSEGVKRFLAKKTEEEKRKTEGERIKKEELLKLRDHKAQSRINKHLKICKSANKSVLADAIDYENTAVTIAGPSQPDEDDYGYTSREASDFYDKLMSKYNSMPAEKPLFSSSSKKSIIDIASTKDRVKQAIRQEQDDPGQRKKRKAAEKSDKGREEIDYKSDRTSEHAEKQSDKDDKPKAKKKPPPPPMDFGTLLKIAEKKQFEPIVIETKAKPKPEEVERPMTARQKKEFEKEREWREKKALREKNPQLYKSLMEKKDAKSQQSNNNNNVNGKQANGVKSNVRIPKLSNGKAPERDPIKSKTNDVKDRPKAQEKSKSDGTSKNLNRESADLERMKLLEERRKIERERQELEEMRRKLQEEREKLSSAGRNASESGKPRNTATSQNQLPGKSSGSGKPSSSKDIKPRQFPPPDVRKANGIQSRQFPPPDVRKPNGIQARQFPPADMRRTPSKGPRLKVNKRRIEDDEDDYDPEMDDFIDNDGETEQEEVSKYISEIFGYNRSKYRNLDDEDDAAMESSFAQQMREEVKSAKIGIMEDLQDMEMEREEKKRKATMIKKRRRKI